VRGTFEAVLADGRLLKKLYVSADGVIDAGELNYKDFSNSTVRKVIYLQREFSMPKAEERYDPKEIEGFRSMAKHFLSSLKDEDLSQKTLEGMEQELKRNFPKLKVPT
jgi:hypothetical protein